MNCRKCGTPLPNGVAFCPNCGQSNQQMPQQYQHGQSQHSRPQYGQPQHGQPQHGQSQHGRPQYGQPQYGQSQHGQSQHGQSQYGQPQYGQPQYGQPQQIPGKGMSIAGLVCGILGIVGCFIPVVCYFTFVLAVLGVIFGVKGNKLAKEALGRSNGLATAGLICGIIGTAFGAVGVICTLACVGAAGAAGFSLF